MSRSAAAATMSDPNTNARIGSILTLHLDLDDLTDPYVADELHDGRDAEQHLTHALAEEQVHVIRVDERQRDAEEGRKRQEHVAREASVRRVHPDLPQDLEPLAHDVREILENLGQVAAGLPLNQHGRGEEADVDRGNAVREILQRILERQPEVL